MDRVGDLSAITARGCLRNQQGCATAVEEVVIDGQDQFWAKFVDPAPTREPVEPIASYVAWIRVCARNRSIDKLRQLMWRVPMSGDGCGSVDATMTTSQLELYRICARDAELCAFIALDFTQVFRRNEHSLPSILFIRAAYHTLKPNKRLLLAGEAAGLQDADIAKVHELFGEGRVPRAKHALEKRRTDSLAQDKVRLRSVAADLADALSPEQVLKRTGAGCGNLRIAHLLALRLDRLIDSSRSQWLESAEQLTSEERERFSSREIIVLAAHALGDTAPSIAEAFGVSVAVIDAVIARAQGLEVEEP